MKAESNYFLDYFKPLFNNTVYVTEWQGMTGFKDEEKSLVYEGMY
jgi:hypothetical protein